MQLLRGNNLLSDRLGIDRCVAHRHERTLNQASRYYHRAPWWTSCRPNHSSRYSYPTSKTTEDTTTGGPTQQHAQQYDKHRPETQTSVICRRHHRVAYVLQHHFAPDLWDHHVFDQRFYQYAGRAGGRGAVSSFNPGVQNHTQL